MMENMARRLKIEGQAICQSFFDSRHVRWIRESLFDPCTVEALTEAEDALLRS